MNIPIEPGKKYLLDGKVEVTVLKSFDKIHSRYVIEIPRKSVEIVQRSRLDAIPTGEQAKT